MKYMIQFIETIFLFAGGITSIFFIIGLFSPLISSNIEEMKCKNRDLKIMFGICICLLIAIESFDINNFLDIKKQYNNEIQKNNELVQQKHNLDSINNILKANNDSALVLYNNTRNTLQNIIFDRKEISTEIETNVGLCFNNIDKLLKASDNSIKIIRNIKSEINRQEKDSDYVFSENERAYFNKTLDIIVNNAKSSQHIYFSMENNLCDILDLSQRLKLKKSNTLYNLYNAYRHKWKNIDVITY